MQSNVLCMKYTQILLVVIHHFLFQDTDSPDVYETSDLPEDDQAQAKLVSILLPSTISILKSSMF